MKLRDGVILAAIIGSLVLMFIISRQFRGERVCRGNLQGQFLFHQLIAERPIQVFQQLPGGVILRPAGPDDKQHIRPRFLAARAGADFQPIIR